MTNFDYTNILQSYPGAIQVGQGGQKRVYRYVSEKHGVVALKIGPFYSRDTQERIRREIRVLREINSPSYPTIHDYIEVDGGSLFLKNILMHNS